MEIDSAMETTSAWAAAVAVATATANGEQS